MLNLFNIIISYVYIYPLGFSTILISLNYNVYPIEFRVLGAKITAMVKLFTILIFSTADNWFVRNESLCNVLWLKFDFNQFKQISLYCVHREKMENVLDYFFPILSLYFGEKEGENVPILYNILKTKKQNLGDVITCHLIFFSFFLFWF